MRGPHKEAKAEAPPEALQAAEGLTVARTAAWPVIISSGVGLPATVGASVACGPPGAQHEQFGGAILRRIRGQQCCSVHTYICSTRGRKVISSSVFTRRLVLSHDKGESCASHSVGARGD